MSRRFSLPLCMAVALTFAVFAFPAQETVAQTVGPMHASEPDKQVHQYVAGEATQIWPGTNGQELISQADWTAFFEGPHHEIWDYVGARTEYYNTPPNPSIKDGTITYGGVFDGILVDSVLWTPPDEFHDMPYSAFDATAFNTPNPLVDPLENDDGSQAHDGNRTVGSWPNVGDDIIEGAHEEDLFFIHEVFTVLYEMYGSPEFNPASDYLQDEFFNGLDYDAAEAFYHHLWRRTAHNDDDIEMMGVSWSNALSPWDELIVMPDIFGRHPSPVQIVEAYWQLALDYYLGQNGRTQDTGLAYYFLGRVSHLLVDLCTPAHAHCDPHGPAWIDSYESYMGDTDRYPQYTHNEIPVFDSNGIVIDTTAWGYNIGDWPYKDFTYVRNEIPGTKWDPFESDDQVAQSRWNGQSDLFRLFWCTAELSDNFDSNDANGEIDAGSRRAGGFSEYELRSVADEMMPQAMISLAELYKLFWDSVTVTELTQINLVSPADQAVLTSSPVFEWIPDGGTNNAFAVDLALSPTGPVYSTYETLHLIIYDTTWTMPQSLWNRIPSGKRLYWRVRGVDLDQTPFTVVTSEEVWSFYKQ